MKLSTHFIGIALWFWTACGLLAAPDSVEFNRDIRPILSDNCFKCHGPDKNARKAKLRLDLEEETRQVRDGAAVIAPGKPEESLMMKRIAASDPDVKMPPPDSGRQLSAQQIQLIRQWILDGGEYQGHWSFLPPQRAPLPEPQHADRVHNEIDSFILARLEAKDLKPSTPAGKRVLLRRVSLDLTGLPPTAEEIRNFLNDNSPNAFENVVDRLLKSRHYGERMAVPWLDGARYADSAGYHGDQVQNIFPYRDYVIRSFNENKPFDQFTIEQLAGDLLPNPTVEQLVATGFNRLNMMTREGGAQAKEYLAKYQADRVRTVSTAWLGATMACAECHDHKFDPFTTKDFYSMSAFFADLKQWGVYGDYNYLGDIPELKGFNNDSPFPPEIQVENDYLKNKLAGLESDLDRLIERIESASAKEESTFEAWKKDSLNYLKLRRDGWNQPMIVDVESDKKTESELQPDGSVLLLGEPERNEKHEITLQPMEGSVAALRLEILPHARHRNQVARGDRKTFQANLSLELKSRGAEEPETVSFWHADADLKKLRHHRGLPELNILGGWESDAGDIRESHTAVYWLKEPLNLEPGDQLSLTLRSEEIGCFRVSLSPFTPSMDNLSVNGEYLYALLKQEADKLSEEESARLAEAWLQSTAAEKALFDRHQELNLAILNCRDGKTFTMVAESTEPMRTRVLPRGNWQDDSGEVVQPAIPEMFQNSDSEKPDKRLTRLDLARWIVSRDNPLTARVFVNRLWKQLFGRGFSNTLEDLGAQGEWPSHPDLLDWLAVDFMESDWDVKRLVKKIVLSSTYRQTSNPTEAQRKADPKNLYYARQSPRRLEAEFVRDNALAVSGLLNVAIGGPSAKPYQPAGYYANLNFPRRVYQPSEGDRQYRRGLYTHWQRTFLHPMLANFDGPSREECTVDRTVSNTPQQSLTLLNDPAFVEAARSLADHTLSDNREASFESILNALFVRVLARPPETPETNTLKSLYEDHLKYFNEHEDEAEAIHENGNFKPNSETPPEILAAWTSVCRVLLNLHETITRL